MKKLAFVVLLFLVAAGAFAQVSDLVLSGLLDRNVVLTKTDGSVISGKLSSYDAVTVVVIKEGGDVVEIARKDLKSLKVAPAATAAATGAPAAAAAPAASTASAANPAPAAAAPSGDAPAAPNLASVKGKSQAEKQSAYDAQFKVVVDPMIVALKMGESGRFFPLAQWDPVLRDVPAAYQLFKSYNGRRVTATVFLVGGLVLLIPGTVMSILGPYLVGIILDLGAIAFDVVSLIVQPGKNDLQKIADAYNAETKKALQLSYASPPEAGDTVMGVAPPRSATEQGLELTLLTLRL